MHTHSRVFLQKLNGIHIERERGGHCVEYNILGREWPIIAIVNRDNCDTLASSSQCTENIQYRASHLVV